MSVVNMLHAKSNLSRLVEAVESGAEDEIIIVRNGKPAARLAPIALPVGERLCAAQGMFKVPSPDKRLGAQIAKLFTNE